MPGDDATRVVKGADPKVIADRAKLDLAVALTQRTAGGFEYKGFEIEGNGVRFIIPDFPLARFSNGSH